MSSTDSTIRRRLEGALKSNYQHLYKDYTLKLASDWMFLYLCKNISKNIKLLGSNRFKRSLELHTWTMKWVIFQMKEAQETVDRFLGGGGCCWRCGKLCYHLLLFYGTFSGVHKQPHIPSFNGDFLLCLMNEDNTSVISETHHCSSSCPGVQQLVPRPLSDQFR